MPAPPEGSDPAMVRADRRHRRGPLHFISWAWSTVPYSPYMHSGPTFGLRDAHFQHHGRGIIWLRWSLFDINARQGR